jgi:hypothetical protein
MNNLKTGDYCLSGFCQEDFGVTAKCLMRFCSQFQTKELLIWDTNLGVNRTSFAAGTNILDTEGVLTFNYQAAHRMSCVVSSFITDVQTNVIVTIERNDNNSWIEGLLYLDQILSQCHCQRTAIFELGLLVLKLSQALNAVVLNVADEDDEALSISKTHPILLPSLLGAYDQKWLTELSPQLVRAGAFVEDSQEGQLLVWVQHPDDFLSDKVPNPEIFRILQQYLLAAL